MSRLATAASVKLKPMSISTQKMFSFLQTNDLPLENSFAAFYLQLQSVRFNEDRL